MKFRRAMGVSSRLGTSLVLALAGLLIVETAARMDGTVLAQVARDGVTPQRIERAADEPASWLTYSGNYAGHRYSTLDQIHRGNVSKLRPAWVYQFPGPPEIETTPLVADGVLYVTEPPCAVTAIDVHTGRRIWRFSRAVAEDAILPFGVLNRGAALLGNNVYVGTADGHLIALDTRTGNVVWDVVVADYKLGYGITGAPLAVKDMIITGIAGGEAGVRGFLDAYDAETGERVWRHWTVPRAGEPGSETWEGESWRTGGAPTWVTGSYDPELNLVIWGTGNPGPPWNGDQREGDNLYSDSFLGLEADTGEMRWYFQFTPHDEFDFDATHVPVLVNRTMDGQERKLVINANRNGFYYVFDRETGEYLLGKPFTEVNWATGLDEEGRPIRNPKASPRLGEEVQVLPGPYGATNWYSPSYSPTENLLFVPVRIEPSLLLKSPLQDFVPGRYYLGGGHKIVPGADPHGKILAIEPETGTIRWEWRLETPPMAGLLSTAGGLVFGGTHEGQVFALDSTKGKPLWHFEAGGHVIANPISYEHQGKQYVAVAAGRTLMVFSVAVP